MISNTPNVSVAEFERQTGWLLKAEGACKDDRCIQLSEQPTNTIDLRTISERLNMPLVHDDEAGLWCLGPESGGRALTSAVAPDLELPDWRGETFHLSSLRGKKALLVAWASW
jgi:hypothetical protein